LPEPGRAHPALIFAVTLVSIFLLHFPLLRLPYFWDEAGYYIPSARDILLTGSLIPHSTISNAHPPLVLLWIALWWKVVGYAPLVTRSAMLVLSAFALLGVFRLAERAAGRQVAIAATLCTAAYPVFFAQSSLAQVDLAAAGFVFWGLTAYFDRSSAEMLVWFALGGLAKETAVLAPLALAAWEFLGLFARRSSLRSFWRSNSDADQGAGDSTGCILTLLLSALPLAFWYAYHYRRTGYVFGNPEFFRYNVASTLNLARFALALVLRVWQVCGYLHLWVLVLAALFAMCVLEPRKHLGLERPRIALPEQMILYVVVTTYAVAMALIGGAVLARYMLPAVPLVIILCVSTLWRRMRHWQAATALIAMAFVVAWFWNPPYGFSPEDNLSYRDYVILHENGERFLEARYPMARVLTAWPATDEITRPWLGYTTRPMNVLRLQDFSVKQVLAAAASNSDYDVVLAFSTKYEAGQTIGDRWPAFARLRERWKSEFFGYHRDLPPEAIAHILGGRIVFSEQRQGQWIAVIVIEGMEEADYRTLVFWRRCWGAREPD
jgi:Dolichyl-phosphate-mannose-protein mannosyltransferase